MDLNDERLQNISNLNAKHGQDVAAKILGIKSSSIERYIREASIRNIIPETPPDDLPPEKGPKIFIFDLENAPTRAGVWGLWKQNVNQEAITEEWFMISWSGKWLFDTEIYSDVLTSEEALACNDKRIMESLRAFIDSADILIGHNIIKFDNKKMNTRFIINGIASPSPYKCVDTLTEARKNFSFSSNRLDYLCKQFGLSRKADPGGMKRWMGCMDGNPEDLLELEKYNKQDIVASEELYLAMRGFMNGHPNLALYTESDVDMCYRCMSVDLEWPENKYYYTNVNKYSVYKCNHCGGHGRSRFSAMTKDDRKHILSPIAR